MQTENIEGPLHKSQRKDKIMPWKAERSHNKNRRGKIQRSQGKSRGTSDVSLATTEYHFSGWAKRR